MSRQTTGYLQVRDDGGGDRHFVGEIPIHCGALIRAHLDGAWVDGRYEASYRGGRIQQAWFYFDNNNGDERTIPLTDDIRVQVDR